MSTDVLGLLLRLLRTLCRRVHLSSPVRAGQLLLGNCHCRHFQQFMNKSCQWSLVGVIKPMKFALILQIRIQRQ